MPRCWAVFVARVILGLIFLMAGIWKVFELGAVEHARNLFVVAYEGTFLPAWSLWATGRRPGPGVEAFGHLLAEPLYAFNTHAIPRTLLLVVVLVLFEEDRWSVDAWLQRKREGA